MFKYSLHTINVWQQGPSYTIHTCLWQSYAPPTHRVIRYKICIHNGDYCALGHVWMRPQRWLWTVIPASAFTVTPKEKKKEENSRIYSTLSVASKFARFESNWLQNVGNIAREIVQNTHHWSGWTETANENGVDQARSCRHCGSHSSVASLILNCEPGCCSTLSTPLMRPCSKYPLCF